MRSYCYLFICCLPIIALAQEPELVLPIGHTSDVYAVSFSPDGQSIVTGSFDSTAILWSLQGEQIQTFEGHTSSVRAVSADSSK